MAVNAFVVFVSKTEKFLKINIQVRTNGTTDIYLLNS